MNWREHIEARIAALNFSANPDDWRLAESLQALLDVAVAAEDVIRESTIIFPNTTHSRLQDALNSCIDKLREAGDE